MRTKALWNSPAESIAIVGMQGRFPGARNISALWKNLIDGVETISTFSAAELTAAGIDPAYLNVPGYVNRGCVLDEIDQFDAGFFGYSARDAETMDPQQRIFLECAWESLELAGYDPDTYPGTIGVFAGSDQSSYLYQICNNVDISAAGYGGMMAIGNEKDYVATQVSYKLNLCGPSMGIQTSCSTSLVAVCMACQSVLHGYCDMALAGGVAISVPQRRGYWYQPGAIVSPDGHCRPFDASAQGTVVGNAVGIVVLKRLSDALADGDTIHAVIKGFALNNDGAAKIGYTAPSVDGQAQVIRRAQQMAGIEPETIGYVEAHGTATALGDPIEVAALTKAFRERTNRRQFCGIGSLKSNTGHLSSAAGIAGLIKGIQVIEHGVIPKSLHYERPNPQIDFAKSPFYVAAETKPWPANGHPRRAGVSSFGVGGTNAHVVLEEAPKVAADPAAPEKQLLVLSAHTATALETATNNLVACLEQKPGLDLANVAFTLQVGRKAFPHRRVLIFNRSDRADLITALRTRDPQRTLTTHTEARDRAVVFMFSGQGTQYVNMGRDLYETEKTFRENVDTCAAILKGEIGLDLRDIIYPAGNPDLSAQRLRQTSMTQPALFVIEYALARLWMEWGVQPRATLGHSIGEYVSACLSDVMTLPEALAVVAMRGRLMESLPGGSMLAVPLPESVLQPLLNREVCLAAVNGPSMSVLAGPTSAIDAIETQFAEQGLPCRRLHTSHAFHSSMMDPVITQFVSRVRATKLRPPQIPYLSNVTGSWITPELATTAEYWGAHLRQTVRFADCLRELMVFPDLVLLEVGPGQTLGLLARQQGSRANSQVILSSLRSSQEPVNDSELLKTTVGQLWMSGASIDWVGFHAHEKRRRIELPTYPFERQRFWLGPIEEIPAEKPATLSQLPVSLVQPAVAPVAELKKVTDWFFVPNWKHSVGTSREESGAAGPWLIFEDREGLGAAICEQLTASGRTVYSVAAGASFDRDDTRYTIRLGERADYSALIADLKTRQQYPSRIVHLYGVDRSELSDPRAEFDDAQRRSFYSVVFLAQALAQAGAGSQVQIGVVTSRLHAVLGDEELHSSEAPVLGACKVISQEFPSIRCRAIDLIPSDSTSPRSIIDELTRERFDAVVAYRKGRRWVQDFEPMRIEASQAKPALLREGGVYLVTGGLGNIALLLAEAIAKKVKAKFVLTGRSAFRARDLWDSHLAAHPLDATSTKIRQLKAIESLGSEVMIQAADAADPAQMRVAIASATERWGSINGVIHGAANLAPDAFGSVREIDHATGNGHFRPKAHGLLVLEQLLSDQKPDFYVLLSSLSATLGGLGLAAYAASNAYLDAEAQRCNQLGRSVWISLNWDAWDFSAAANSNKEAISPAEGQEAFTRIFASSLKQVVISCTPLGDRLNRWVNLAVADAVKSVPAAQPSSHGTVSTAHERPSLSTQFVAPRTETEKTVAGVWEHLLGVAPIGIYDKFFELGGHSLLAIQLLGQLQEIYQIDLPIQRIFEAPTVAQLSESIDGGRSSPSVKDDTPDQNLTDEMLSLVEGLSEAELEALLNEAEAEAKVKEAHG